MPIWYPPRGGQDKKRLQTVPLEDRDYGLFCIEFVASVVERRPGHCEALKLAANYLTMLGFYADGLAVDRSLAQLCPGDPAVFYNLACSLSLNGFGDEAFSALNAAVDNGYLDSRHMAEDQDLETLRDDPRFRELLAKATAAEAVTSTLRKPL